MVIILKDSLHMHNFYFNIIFHIILIILKNIIVFLNQYIYNPNLIFVIHEVLKRILKFIITYFHILFQQKLYIPQEDYYLNNQSSLNDQKENFYSRQ